MKYCVENPKNILRRYRKKAKDNPYTIEETPSLNYTCLFRMIHVC